ncbi:MAG: PatA/PatG family cyanobactin maturation protease [Xanthobacteraceae bacterium]
MEAQSHPQLTAIRAALASAGPGSSEILIGIVDGIPDLSHPCLRKAAIEIMDTMVPTDAGGADDHGTEICSLIFGSEAPIFGLAPGCSGLVLPLFLRKGTDPAIRPVSQLDLARAITFALERGVSIINISAGQKSATTEPEAHLEQALRHCAERRVLLTAAAGNQGCACINLPAGVEIALAVGALGKKGQPLEVSNWAEPYRQNGLLAPGDELPVAVPGGNVSSASGTSFATAVVTGVAALLLSVARREGYRIDPLDVREILLESAAPCKLDGDGACDRYLAGTLDAVSALAMLHRAGTSHSSFAAVQPNEFPQSGRGTFAMSIAGSSELNAVEAAGVSQAACSCETKSDEEAQAAKLTPQGALRAPDAPIFVQQNGNVEIGLTQQACSCGGGQPPQLVFALGALWFDFGTEARYDAIVQQIGDPVRANNPAELFAFLRENLHFASGLTFILMQEQIPLYAIQPAGPFALQIYSAMLDALESSLDAAHNKEQRVSIPGVIAGSTRLLNGMTVPVVFPDLRGMYKWQSSELIAAAKAAVGKDVASDDAIFNFLNRVYYELRNLGVAPQERALNYAATNAYQTNVAFADSAGRNLALDSITVAKSPICRPDSDCWDVQLLMFDPENERRASRVYRYTVDVSDVLPVTVGTVRSWAVRTGSL